MKHARSREFPIKVDKLSEVVRAWLFNFDIDGSTVKLEHKTLLNEAIGPVIKDGGAIKLLGLPCTTKR
jgi:hypothetical protein